MQSIGGCSNGYCCITGRVPPGTVHTNGGCNCWDERNKARRYMNAVPRFIERLRAAPEPRATISEAECRAEFEDQDASVDSKGGAGRYGERDAPHPKMVGEYISGDLQLRWTGWLAAFHHAGLIRPENPNGS